MIRALYFFIERLFQNQPSGGSRNMYDLAKSRPRHQLVRVLFHCNSTSGIVTPFLWSAFGRIRSLVALKHVVIAGCRYIIENEYGCSHLKERHQVPPCNKCQKVLIRSGVMKYGFLESFSYLVKMSSCQQVFVVPRDIFLISVFNVAKLTALTQVKLQ